MTTFITSHLINAADIADNADKALKHIPESILHREDLTPLLKAIVAELNRFPGWPTYSEVQNGQTTGGLYVSEREQAERDAREEEARLAVEAPAQEAREAPVPEVRESGVTEFLSEAVRRVNPLTGVAEQAIEWLFGSSEARDTPAQTARDAMQTMRTVSEQMLSVALPVKEKTIWRPSASSLAA